MSKSTILITGGTGKFGRKFVEHFVHKGWKVLFTSTSQARAIELESAFGGDADIKGLVANFTLAGSAQGLVKTLGDRGLPIHHLVNNARSLGALRVDGRGATAREDFLAEYLMDVVVPYELATSLHREQPGALQTVTNIGSQYGLVAATPALYADYRRQSPIQYGVAKAALHHLTKELAVRFADAGTRVNCIAYGGVEGRVDDAFRDRYARLTPSKRMLREDELAGPLDFLVSERSSAMTGQTIVVDGGWTVW